MNNNHDINDSVGDDSSSLKFAGVSWVLDRDYFIILFTPGCIP